MIYLDHNATTPADPRALALVTALLAESGVGNPSSVHFAGQRARAWLDRARAAIALSAGLTPAKGETDRVILTSGATEADHLGVIGAARWLRRAWHPDSATPATSSAHSTPPGTIATLAIDHPALLRPAATLVAAGWRDCPLPYDAHGLLDVEAAVSALATMPRPWLIAIAAVHHELGLIQPLTTFAAALSSADARWAVGADASRSGRGYRLHVDAAQASGRLPLPTLAGCADQLVISGHKAGGIGGAGALILGHGVKIDAVIDGTQEKGLRGGTENLVGAVALGAAAERFAERCADHDALRPLRDAAWRGIVAVWPQARRHADVEREHETGHVLSVMLPGIAAEAVVMALDVAGICVSAGAACSSGTTQPSPAVAALAGDAVARSTVRISLGPGQSRRDIDALVTAMGAIATRSAAIRGR